MLSVRDAETTIFNLTQPLQHPQDTEIVDLLSVNRILATPITSQLDFPHWDNSAMDGYAVRYADVESANHEQPVILEIVEEIPAGYQPQSTIQSGQAARIFTGAVMPKGADTVVMQEETHRDHNHIQILSAPKNQEFVRHRGSYYQAGNQLLPAGIRLNAPEIAVLAAAQCVKISVYRKPKVAILSTGNELVRPNQSLQPGQIVDSNQYALAALVHQMGAEPLVIGIVPDDKQALQQAIADSITTADIVLSSGGVSVGEYDYVEQIITSLQGTIHIRAVAMKPGKPLTFATFDQDERNILYFGLPGNPVSALVTFWRFVQPAIAKFSGLVDAWQPQFINATTTQELRSAGKRETYVWGRLSLVDGVYQFQLAGGSHSSGNLINLAQTNALAVIPVGEKVITAGNAVKVLKIGN
ncbi:gephyrin-like molybdotransferase Glp [Calothrix rhizosoleniae]|uniref:molybdopterin molybdotransferase MoeA n=1 Tax=Calothrix rhizosoleniae TaxID=888997 RepID=UPI000B4A3981|nr:gephyrin-like molybdotransferase Glp [Calothrix rhizosoleniae]